MAFTGALAQTVASINGKAVGSKEFLWFYKKSHPEQNRATATELEDFLKLYLNFKLKALSAKEMGFDKDTAYLAEVKNYETALRAQKKPAATASSYAMIMNEYKDAVLMFNISEIKVWSKGQNEEPELIEFYEKHRADYNNSPFEEVKEKVIVDYQQKLEQDWVADLRKQYIVKTYPAELKKLAKLQIAPAEDY